TRNEEPLVYRRANSVSGRHRALDYARVRVGAHAVACDIAGGVGRAADGQYLTDAKSMTGTVPAKTYRPRRFSSIPSRRTRPRAGSLSRSARMLRWTSGRERATTGLASAAGAGPAGAGPGVPTGTTLEDTSSTLTVARITATPGNLIC